MKVIDLLRIMGGRTKLRILDNKYEYLPLFIGCLDENFENFGGKNRTLDRNNSVLIINDHAIDLYDLDVAGATVINGEDVLTINVEVEVKDKRQYLEFVKCRAVSRKWFKR